MDVETPSVTVVGGGLAGSEAAWQAAERGVTVTLYEMRPVVQTPAHTTDCLAELVCSNSLGADQPERAAGLLKAELRLLGSMVLKCADLTRVPAGGALAVDRTLFAAEVTRRIEEHQIHTEHCVLSPEVAERINRARSEGRRIVAVGTTTVRVLESAAQGLPAGVGPWDGPTSLFIYPGYRFRVVDALITNFHLPRSSLLMLVSALAGMEPIRRAYSHAVQSRYRFFSYGDAMFIETPEHS